MLMVAEKITKSFGPTMALDTVSVEFKSGEIHAVIGENGAGKSTLMNALGGFVIPDSGTLEIDGTPCPVGDVKAMRAMGIEMVHQHFMLVPGFSVGENLVLSSLFHNQSHFQPQEVLQRARAKADELGWKFEMDAITESLPVGTQQRLEILKALIADAQMIILDEPTAVLSEDEVTDLFSVLRSLKEDGKAVILIAHKLREVLSIADRVTILRNGRLQGSHTIDDCDEQMLAKEMLGEDAESATRAYEKATGDCLVRLVDVNLRGDRGNLALTGLSLQLQAGEVLGIGGVDGNGQHELAELVCGLRSPESGSADVQGKVAYIPQDRRAEGLSLHQSVQENLMILDMLPDRIKKFQLLNPSEIRAWAQEQVEKFNIKAESITKPVSGLSGGNQQKVVVSRAITKNAPILVAMNPTRGVDFNSSAMIRDLLRQVASDGVGVLLISSDQDELNEVADRIMYLSRGKLYESRVGAAL